MEFTHLDNQGRVQMVDISAKLPTIRQAIAEGRVYMQSNTFEKICDQTAKKGNVLETARIAGIMAAKNTSGLIPLCHPINLTNVWIDFTLESQTPTIKITAGAEVSAPTGVEMEALTAVAVAALTIYDMCKSYDRGMTISGIVVVKKSGGKSGEYIKC